jgi:(2Fe-2S) ferredoxin
MSGYTKKILICTRGKTCPKRNSAENLKGMQKALKKYGLEDFFKIKKTDCLGGCKYGPIVRIEPDGCMYGFVTPDDCQDIIKRHAKKKKPLKRLKIRKKK